MPRIRQRVAVVTGSPNEIRLLPRTDTRKPKVYKVSPSYDKLHFTQAKPKPKSNDPELLDELRMDAQLASSYIDWTVWNSGAALADMECPHGHLPNDMKISCQCWGLPVSQLHADLREARKRLVSRPYAALYTLVYGL